ncbi:MAG TPA: carboxypeptidase regulatory-like domain-containing protein [Thermoanaerobaculia bacterium]|nr:carboxypeptidase regulatory-like domain-containing protein [Thermoanaerobaculia bacterium]
MKHYRIVLAAVFFAILVWPCSRVEAQEIFASLTGTVTDAQKGAVPGVTVRAENVDTKLSSQTTTDSHGGFTISKLQPGRYRLTAALEGFSTFIREGIVLRTAETGTINVTLALGAVAEAITVSASLSAVETNESTLSQTVDNKKISELPLNGRQVYQLLQLTPGVTFNTTTFGATGSSGTRAWDVGQGSSYSIHGSRTGANEFLISGAPISGTGSWSYAPPVDAIEELKVQTASTDASYGRTSGGVVNLTLKSGANEMRFSNTLMYRGTSLDSKSIQNINSGTTISGHKYYDNEGMLSGPIRRDRTFYMVGYQAFYENIPFPNTVTVPTDLQRAGDFRGTLNGAGQQITIFDPLTTRPDPNRAGRFIRDPISCNGVMNVICPERFSAVAKALLQYIPRATASGDIAGANNFVNSPGLGYYRYKSYLTRVDHSFTDDHRVYFTNSGNWGSERRSENSLPPGPALRSDNWPTKRISNLGALDDVITLGSSALIDTRVSYDRFDEPHAKQFGPVESPLPFKTAYQVTSEPWYPHISWTGYQEMFGRPFRDTKNEIYGGQSSVSKALGQHFLKAGTEARQYRLTRKDQNEENGRFDFSGGFTRRDPQQADATSGNAFASFLLGFPDGANTLVDITAASVRQYRYYGLFVQDDWKINPRMSLGLGLRWDYQPPVTERNNQLVVGFDASTPSPLQVSGLQLRGGLLYPGINSNKHSPYKGDWNNFQPRLNFTYQLSNRIVGRANAGRSYLALTGGGGNGSNIEGLIQNGFSQRTSFISSVQTGVPFNTFDKPYPEGFVPAANGAQGLATGIGTSISFMNPNFEVPYSDQWMAGFNVELPWNASLDFAYVGNHVYKLPTANGTLLNEVPYAERIKAIESMGGNASYLSTAVTNPFAGLVPGTSLNTATVSRGQLLRPYQQFIGITETLDNNGWSSYKGFEIVANKRLSHGLTSTLSYTWSRTYDAIDYLNNGYDDKPFKDLASIDRTHHIALTALYNLPFGPGRAIGGNTRGLVAAIIGGWQFNLLYEWESGTPTAMPNGILRQPTAGLSHRSRDQWFDNSTKSNPHPDGSYAWDTLPPNAFRVAGFRMHDVRDPSITNSALSLFKNTPAGIGTVQLRFEVFNLLNKRVYGGPNTTITSAQFGKITPNQINFPRQAQVGIRYWF